MKISEEISEEIYRRNLHFGGSHRSANGHVPHAHTVPSCGLHIRDNFASDLTSNNINDLVLDN